MELQLVCTSVERKFQIEWLWNEHRETNIAIEGEWKKGNYLK